jgi:hypothetical protein
VGGLSAARRKGRHPDPNVLVWATDLGGDATHIWIGWLDDPPTNQVSSPTGYFADPSISNVVFKHIDQNWYLGSDGQIPAAR